ncbi:hypothetical protein [Clostridium sp. BJN0013]|uniref:hypothetical protein n=1 Tax=Clostridium sp. BJN0013 TaxID=3236840 RepID=UPI0034C5B84C
MIKTKSLQLLSLFNVSMKEDILVTEAYIIDIVNAVVKLDNAGSGIMLFIVSTDSGVSWKTSDGS